MSVQGYRELGLSSLTSRSELEKSTGEGSDVVAKELVELDDGVYAPEGTPQVLTYAFDRPGRYSYVSTMMRGERIQKGRLREFTQLGVEELSTPSIDPLQAAPSIELMVDVLEGYDPAVSLGYLGCSEDQSRLREELGKVLPGCDDCRRRQGTNPVRMLDCKVCDKATWPTFETVGCDPCRARRDLLVSVLRVPVRWDPYLVRGLDYYQGPVWEVTAGGYTVGGGGMYRSQVVRGATPRVLNGIGWALGLERLLLQTRAPELPLGPRAVAVLSTRPDGIAESLRLAGGRVPLYGTLKDVLRRADQMGCSDLLILGERELEARRAPVKVLATGEQTTIGL